MEKSMRERRCPPFRCPLNQCLQHAEGLKTNGVLSDREWTNPCGTDGFQLEAWRGGGGGGASVRGKIRIIVLRLDFSVFLFLTIGCF